MTSSVPILQVDHVSRAYSENGKDFSVLVDVTFDVGERDFVCLVGPSGCGKSTLLREIMGLDKPTAGTILFQGSPVARRDPRLSMVFQSFALLPWLTVARNVELGVRAHKVPIDERRARVQKYIDAVGLGGFENAYPRELSGGMRQRVGLARALAMNPSLLCMDEPFSTLDELTAQNLRDEILELWMNPALPPSAILMVTHDIDEAVYLADHVVVLSARPGQVIELETIDLPRPRNRKEPEFYGWVDEITSLIV